MTAIIVVGAGGHGKVVADILLRQGRRVTGFVDDDDSIRGHDRLQLPVLGRLADYNKYAECLLAAGIGVNATRKTVAERLGDDADRWFSAVHPSAIIAPSVSIGHGVVIAAAAVINPDVEIGDFAIINTGATVDHDCVLGPYCHVGPGANLGGGVQVGEGTLIGIGASVIPYRSIGQWATIGAGSCVISNIPSGVTAVGVPARPVQR